MAAVRDEDRDGWDEYRRLVIEKLEDLAVEQDGIRKEVMHWREAIAKTALTDHELRTIRQLLKEWDWWRMFWRTVRLGSAWTVGVVTLIWGGRDVITRVVEALFKGWAQ